MAHSAIERMSQLDVSAMRAGTRLGRMWHGEVWFTLCSIAQRGCLVTSPLPFLLSFFFTFKKSRPWPAFFVPRQRNVE